MTGWRRSSRCDTGHCVEILIDEGGVSMRDSKAPPSALAVVLQWPAEAWRRVVGDLKGDGLHDGSDLVVKVTGSVYDNPEWLHVWRPGEPWRALAFTRPEWTAFVAGVRAGEFDV